MFKSISNSFARRVESLRTDKAIFVFLYLRERMQKHCKLSGLAARTFKSSNLIPFNTVATRFSVLTLVVYRLKSQDVSFQDIN